MFQSEKQKKEKKKKKKKILKSCGKTKEVPTSDIFF